MNGMEKEQALCLEKLAKSFKEVDRQLILWKETEHHSYGLIHSLASPFEQLHACEENSFTGSPLCEFESLKQRLRYKLLKQTEFIMKGLQEDLNTFKMISKKISMLWSSCLQVYTLHSSHLPMSLVCEGSATEPSIANLLEWLSVLDNLHSELYEDKVDLLDRIKYTAPMSDINKAIEEWSSTQATHALRIRDIMEHVAVFLASRM